MVVEEGSKFLYLLAVAYEGGDVLGMMWLNAAGKLHASLRIRVHAGPGFDAPDEIIGKSLGPIEDTPGARETAMIPFRLTVGAAPVGADVYEHHMKVGNRAEWVACMEELSKRGWNFRMRTAESDGSMVGDKPTQQKADA